MNDRAGHLGDILIVDDTRGNLEVLAEILREQGYRVRPAPSGHLAIRAVRAQRPDLILLDIRMPEMDGYEVCRRIKADDETNDIPIIFISALAETADKLEAFRVGGVDYVTKPFRSEEVLARVDVHLKLQRTLEELQAARVAAEAANSAKSIFLQNMSHELRSPLNIILGYASLMHRYSRSLPTEQRDYLNVIIRSGEHLHALIGNILDLSKIEAGTLELELSSFNLDKMLDDLEDMFALRANEKDVELHIEQADDCPGFIRTDPVKLKQVLINLMSNAVTFTQEGGVVLRVSRSDGSAPQAKKVNLTFEVEDSGSGIPEEELDHIFDSFFQGEGGKKAQSGTGLGLAISQDYVNLLGSELQIETEYGRGTKIHFVLPVEISNAEEEASGEDGLQVVALVSGQRTYKILIADDKWANRQILYKLLQPLGFDLREARHGGEAIEIWEKWKPDLIWMHLRMPVMNGFEATQRIKATERGQETVIITVTASAFDEERAIAESIGSDDFLRRPYRLAQVYAMLKKHLGVRFLYDNTVEVVPSVDRVKIQLDALAALPTELLTELESAVHRLDVYTIEGLITQIKSEDESLAFSLETLTQSFEYDQILDAIQRCG